MDNNRMMLIGAIVVALVLVGGIGWFTMGRAKTPVIHTPPPDFINPETGRPYFIDQGLQQGRGVSSSGQ